MFLFGDNSGMCVGSGGSEGPFRKNLKNLDLLVVLSEKPLCRNINQAN